VFAKPMTRRSPAERTGGRVVSPWLLVTLIGSLVVFLALTAIAVTHQVTPDGFDESIHHWALVHRSSGSDAVAAFVTHVGLSVVALPLLFVCALAVAQGPLVEQLKLAGLTLFLLAAGLVARVLVMEVVARQRPPVADWATATSGYAFPSGHTTAATILSGLLAWLIARRWSRRPWPQLVWPAAAAFTVLIGLTRIWLGVHWPTDVLGGWAFGVAWVSLSILLLTWAGTRWVSVRHPNPGRQ
jgi:membrane-associated phospholipid phosphatase